MREELNDYTGVLREIREDPEREALATAAKALKKAIHTLPSNNNQRVKQPAVSRRTALALFGVGIGTSLYLLHNKRALSSTSLSNTNEKTLAEKNNTISKSSTPKPNEPNPSPTISPTTIVPAQTTPEVDSAPIIKTLTPSPEATKERSNNLYLELLKPFIIEAQKRRSERQQTDPEFNHRVDADLNRSRVNFLLFGYGDTFESNNQARIGSPTIISIDLDQNTIDMVSLTHDIEAVEIERFQEKKYGKKAGPSKIDQAYWIGGFDLMRQTIEDATGFSVDFQITMNDQILADMDDHLLHGLEVDIPFNLETQPFYYKNKKYLGEKFSKGRQTLNGFRLMEFMKALPKDYDRTTERNVRKKIVFEALLNVIKTKLFSLEILNPINNFGVNLINFITNENTAGELNTDFDIQKTITNNLKSLLNPKILTSLLVNKKFPRFNKAIYIVDSQSGDGGVEWVDANKNSIIQSEIKNGFYGVTRAPAFEIPFGANPTSKDLIEGYWLSVRKLIKSKLLD